MTTETPSPGSDGEHVLQQKYGTGQRAENFYDRQLLDHLNPSMRKFIGQQELVFIATADSQGECDASLRSGLPGFVHVLNDKMLTYPEYRGNGVLASLGNISENSHIGMMFIDFFKTTIGLHVNGTARIVENVELLNNDEFPASIQDDMAVAGGRRPERWVVVEVEEAYIHCSKHIPLLEKCGKTLAWGTDDSRLKGGDYFGVRATKNSRVM